MTNKEIRRRAWELCRTHFWKLLGASLFISLITSLLAAPYMLLVTQQAVSGEVPSGGALGLGFVCILVLMLAALILEAGLLQYISNLWHGEPAGIPTLFTHARRVLRLLGIGFLMVLLMYAVMLPAILVMVFLVNFAEFLGVILMLALMFFIFYAALRLSPAMTAFILNPEQSAWSCIKTAWRATKGRVRRIFCHTLMLMLPMYAAVILIGLLTPATGAYASPIANAIVSIVTLLFTTLFTVYMQFGQYGLNELLLTAKSAHSNVPAAELWDAAPILPESADEEYEETDEYEDIPESEQENPDNHSDSN